MTRFLDIQPVIECIEAESPTHITRNCKSSMAIEEEGKKQVAKARKLRNLAHTKKVINNDLNNW